MKKSLFAFPILLLLSVLLLVRPHLSTAQGGGGGQLISQATVTDSASQTTVTLDSVDARVNVSAAASVACDLSWSGNSGGVKLVAPHGGSINGQGGVAQVTASAAPSDVNFTFVPGTARGRYTVEISQGTRTEVLEFWVGTEPPHGQAGPALTFNNY